jgi:uncharacterized protein YfaS (alpha-2-macroglobulin family)
LSIARSSRTITKGWRNDYFRSQKSEIRNQKSEVRSQKSEVRSQKSVFLTPVSCLLFGLLFVAPLLAQQNDSPELTSKASQAIDRGLKHLLATQRPDGSWASTEEGDRAVAITALALMSFMARAEFPGSGPNGDALNRAKEWLLKKAKDSPDGYMGTTMYEHGLATLALTEIWGMTKDKKDDDAIQKAIEAAVNVILRSQNEGGGWRYQPQMDAGQDTSVTVMVFIALASARQAGIVVPNETIAKVVKYFESATSQKTGGFNYVPTGVQKNDSIACTGGGAYAAQLAGARGSEMVLSALRFLKERAPGIIENNFGHYYYGHYYAVQAMVQAGDEHYAAWYPQIRDALIQKQGTDGSWNENKKSKGSVAKLAGYETPMAIIILATPHRYIPIYQR